MRCPNCNSNRIFQVPETAFESFCANCDLQFDIRETETEEVQFAKYQQLLAKRGEMRRTLTLAIRAFNQFNEREFPGQYLEMYLAVEDEFGLRKVTQ